MAITAVISPSFAPHIDQLRRAAPAVTLICPRDQAELLAAAPAADAVCGHNSQEFYRAAPRLRWVQSPSAGVESYPLDLFRERGITLTNGKRIYGIQLADHTLALMLAFSRQLPFLMRAQQRGVWESRDNYPPGELLGQRLLVVGLGGTGIEVARRADGFGLRTVAVTRSHQRAVPPFVEALHPPADLDRLLPDVDWVAVCVPLTADTRDLFGERQFALMRPSAYIVCVTRGGIINTAALTRALETGQIAGAGLDVTDPEPLPAEHPLWRMDNVIITPHASGHSPAAFERMVDLLADNLARFAGGQPLTNVVDLERGY